MTHSQARNNKYKHNQHGQLKLKKKKKNQLWPGKCNFKPIDHNNTELEND